MPLPAILSTVLRRICALILLSGGPALAAATLQITPLTWNVIGLDSNKVNQGPNTFPVGARVCNVGDTAATGVTAQFTWDSSNALINIRDRAALTLDDLPHGPAPARPNLLSRVPTNCRDAYFNIDVSRTDAAYTTSRQYRITVAAAGVPSVSTPAGRELYVERLVSQNRNDVTSFTGPATVAVGQIARYEVRATTSSAYEQLENYPILPNSVFQILDVTTTYTTPSNSINSSAYADACGWDNVTRSCVGPTTYAGKIGGTMTSTYIVRIIAGTADTIYNVVYDYSGSSYHYNSDYNDPAQNQAKTLTATAPNLTLSKTLAGPSPINVGNTTGFTFTVTAAAADVYGTTTITDALPAGLNVPDGTLTLSGTNAARWRCGASSNVITCTSVDPALNADGTNTPFMTAGTSSTFTITGVSVTTSSVNVTNTASVRNPNETVTTDNTASLVIPINQPPTAFNDTASGLAGAAVSVNVLSNDTDPNGNGTLNTGSVVFVNPPAGATLSSGARTMTITGQGTWSVAAGGAVTFTPAPGYTGSPTPAQYTVSDAGGLTSSAATITITAATVPQPITGTVTKTQRLLPSGSFTTTPLSVRPGDLIEYCLTATHAGQGYAAATSAFLRDILSAHLAIVDDAYGAGQSVKLTRGAATPTYLTTAAAVSGSVVQVDIRPFDAANPAAQVCFQVRVR